MRWIVIVPSVVLIGLLVLLGYGLTQDPRALPSALIDKPAPAFVLPKLSQPSQTIDLKALEGRVALVNVWASWCVACRSEVSLIAELSQRTGVPVIGMNYKDKPADAKRWLKRFGDPFAVVAVDQSGQTGIDWGVSGVPETFVVDAKGMIRYKVVGPITEEEMRQHLLPELQQLQAES